MMDGSDGSLSNGFSNEEVQGAKKSTVWQCQLCNKCFASKYTLQDHERIHTGEKPYACNICPKRFRARPNLSTHMKGHMGTKPFICSHCSKSFATKQQMQVHERVHSGERPFACDACGRRFTTLGNMKQHRLSHSNERPFICEHCHKGFTSRGSLTNHARAARCPALKALQAPPPPPLSMTSPFGDSMLMLPHNQNDLKVELRGPPTYRSSSPTFQDALPRLTASISCEFCGVRFSELSQYNVHRQQGPCAAISDSSPPPPPPKLPNPLAHLYHHYHTQHHVTSPAAIHLDRLHRFHGEGAIPSSSSPPSHCNGVSPAHAHQQQLYHHASPAASFFQARFPPVSSSPLAPSGHVTVDNLNGLAGHHQSQQQQSSPSSIDCGATANLLGDSVTPSSGAMVPYGASAATAMTATATPSVPSFHHHHHHPASHHHRQLHEAVFHHQQQQQHHHHTDARDLVDHNNAWTSSQGATTTTRTSRDTGKGGGGHLGSNNVGPKAHRTNHRGSNENGGVVVVVKTLKRELRDTAGNGGNAAVKGDISPVKGKAASVAP